MTPAEIAARVAESRARQGLPPTIRDPAFLAELAVRVVDTMVLARQKGGDRGAGSRPAGRGDGSGEGADHARPA